jgi:uncharacterized membrane protein
MMKRISSIDITRGIVMIIMALDHVRDLMHINSITQNPTDLGTTTPLLFFTRFITHLCAPTFVFLAGASAYISCANKNDSSQSSFFIIKRGLWLIFLEFTIVNFGIFFDVGFHAFLFQVIATIGFGFIILGLLMRLSSKAIGIIGLAILFTHNLLPLIPFVEGSILKTILTPFFGPTTFPFAGQSNFIMGYPPIPWLGIMLVGFASGQLFLETESYRKRKFIQIAVGALLLFIVLRFINIYGDSALWSSQKNGLYTFLSFINVSKYPPSLLFCLTTLGIMFLILAFNENTKSRLANIATVYGKVPLFYFVLHFYLIHLTMIVLMFLQGFNWSQLDFASGSFGRPKGVESGVNLWAIYLIWISIVASLYKPCLWFGKYKATHTYWWLKYI